MSSLHLSTWPPEWTRSGQVSVTGILNGGCLCYLWSLSPQVCLSKWYIAVLLSQWLPWILACVCVCVCGRGRWEGGHAWQRARKNNCQKSHDIITLRAVSKPGRPTSNETRRLNNLQFPSIYQLPFSVSIYVAQNQGTSLTLPQWHTQLELFYV